ncbi:glucose/galactose MFS transporter [Pedobacter sp. HMF7647]|uniref:Glucose/galactose MFS transporter n=1 Tax=Hufsiella arboris TaxID=2695275 RepID=A0A7K1Y8N5_9SPHI|nr:sugar MFS transporter [Hufsiella arboris]MXV50945.1 glucose/galactose MFS transporter [Hufsiella arboris]
METVISPAPVKTKSDSKPLLIICALFFIFGFVTWLNGTLIPFLKIACDLKSDVQALFVTFAFYMAYFFLALPSSYILKKTGYKNGMALGLLIMAIGSLIFIPAANTRTFGFFLTGLFIQGTGLSLLQTASNPYASILGPIESAARRISIMGICNKIAGALSPVILGAIVLNSAHEVEGKLTSVTDPSAREVLLNDLASKVIVPYAVMALVLIVLAFLIKRSSLPEIEAKESDDAAEMAGQRTNVFQYPYLLLGALCLFFYVGVEVMAGDVIGTYGKALGMSIDKTRYFTSFTLIAMLAGYIIGIATIPKYISQQASLKYAAILGIILSVLAYLTNGYTSVVCIALLGLANAPMWPAIFPLGIHGLGKLTKTGSALLVMGIAGGAIVPLIYANLKDHLGIANNTAFLVCMLPCYVFILYYAIAGYKVGLKAK